MLVQAGYPTLPIPFIKHISSVTATTEQIQIFLPFKDRLVLPLSNSLESK